MKNYMVASDIETGLFIKEVEEELIESGWTYEQILGVHTMGPLYEASSYDEAFNAMQYIAKHGSCHGFVYNDKVNKVLKKYLEGAKVHLTNDGNIIGYTADGKPISIVHLPNGKVDVKFAGHHKAQPYKNSSVFTLAYGSSQRKVWIGAIVLQLERLANGLPLAEGDYNHCLMRQWNKNGLLEQFNSSNLGGEFLSKEDNNIHKFLCMKIRNTTGYVVGFRMTHPESYKITGVREYTRAYVEMLHIEGVLTIVHDDINDIK